MAQSFRILFIAILNVLSTLAIWAIGQARHKYRFSEGIRLFTMSAMYPGIQKIKIVSARSHLMPSQVYAALAYYYANQETIDAEITAYYRECDRLKLERQSGS